MTLNVLNAALSTPDVDWYDVHETDANSAIIGNFRVDKTQAAANIASIQAKLVSSIATMRQYQTILQSTSWDSLTPAQHTTGLSAVCEAIEGLERLALGIVNQSTAT